MRPQALVEFQDDFPDDTIEDDDEIYRFGGGNIALAVAEMLGAKGAEVGQPVYEGEHGWSIEARWDGNEFYVCVSDLGQEKIIQVDETSSSWLSRLMGTKPQLPLFLRVLHECLVKDGRFHEPRWFRNSDYDTGRDGAPTPDALYPDAAGPAQTEKV